MNDPRRTSMEGGLPVRTDLGGARVEPAGGVAARGRVDPGSGQRQRIPTLRQLASLVVDGILMLPRNYRRGMFLDVLV